MRRFEGKRAVITGGASGLGAAIAQRFAGEGAAVSLIDLPLMAERGIDVAGTINDAGAQAYFVPGDVLDAASIRNAIDESAAQMGGVDLCVASAGVAAHPDAGFRGLLDLDPDHFDFVNNVNVRGVFLTAQRAAQLMIEAGLGGSIVTLASIAAKRPSAGVYSVSKAAVWMLTRTLAAELAPHRIRVNAIGPAYVTTEMLAEHRRGGCRRRSGQAPAGLVRPTRRVASARCPPVAARHREHGVVPVQRRGSLLHRFDTASRRWNDVGHRRWLRCRALDFGVPITDLASGVRVHHGVEFAAVEGFRALLLDLSSLRPGSADRRGGRVHPWRRLGGGHASSIRPGVHPVVADAARSAGAVRLRGRHGRLPAQRRGPIPSATPRRQGNDSLAARQRGATRPRSDPSDRVGRIGGWSPRRARRAHRTPPGPRRRSRRLPPRVE